MGYLVYTSVEGTTMLKEYFKEIQNLDILENEYGFALYRIIDDNLHIQHMFVKPQARAMKIATMLATELEAKAKSARCSTMTCDIEPTNKNATESIRVILSYGFRVLEASDNEVIFYKQI